MFIDIKTIIFFVFLILFIVYFVYRLGKDVEAREKRIRTIPNYLKMEKVRGVFLG